MWQAYGFIPHSCLSEGCKMVYVDLVLGVHEGYLLGS